MKKGIHPENYRPVVFKDMSNDDVFITRSTINAKETIEIDGVNNGPHNAHLQFFYGDLSVEDLRQAIFEVERGLYEQAADTGLWPRAPRQIRVTTSKGT